MLRIISVETQLEDIKAHLNTCGYQVVDMAECVHPVEAVVYCGEEIANSEGSSIIRRCAESTVMVNAAGLTGEQVVARLEAKWG